MAWTLKRWWCALELLNEIERRGFDIWSEPIVLSPYRKLQVYVMTVFGRAVDNSVTVEPGCMRQQRDGGAGMRRVTVEPGCDNSVTVEAGMRQQRDGGAGMRRVTVEPGCDNSVTVEPASRGR